MLLFASCGWLAGQKSAPLPAALERYFTKEAGISPEEQKKLLAGETISKLLPVDPDKEVAVMGAVWIKAPQAEFVKLVKNIEHFESGGAFRVTKRISPKPKLSDFAAMRLPKEDVADLKSCKVGDCEIKLSERALERYRKSVDWSKPSATSDAEAIARELALELATGYLVGGNERLSVYRDQEHPTYVAKEFAAMIGRMPELSGNMNDLKNYLLHYPKAQLAKATSFLYWQEVKFGLKPVVRLSQVVIQERPSGTAIATKMLYGSHYFWTALDLRLLLADPARGPGFWLVEVSRSRSDGLDGFLGRLIRGKIKSEVEKGLVSALQGTKVRLEGKK